MDQVHTALFFSKRSPGRAATGETRGHLNGCQECGSARSAVPSGSPQPLCTSYIWFTQHILDPPLSSQLATEEYKILRLYPHVAVVDSKNSCKIPSFGSCKAECEEWNKV